MLDNIRVVLVNTSHPGNIGAVARAMKTMGLSDLRLVEPDQFPHPYATSRSAGAEDLLNQACVVDTLQEAVADCQLVIGTSARERKIPWPLINPRECAELAGQTSRSNKKVAVVFGREDRGLTNDELALCNYHVNIPACEGYSSLNLGAAVQVIAYELRMNQLEQQPEKTSLSAGHEHTFPEASHKEVERFLAHFEELLTQIEFLDPSNPGVVMTRFRRLFQRAMLDSKEVNMLRGVLSDTQRIIKQLSNTKSTG
ncbi:tRNA (cytosine(32)/uridine(32)-2'-O)-methyltransferase TrmJ [Spartinivicinus poritis]|uniref:tRNA (cytidine/uridine-2'-O-)-methyltransferase TrmJ n=1 Tax=Spartinivicinus poritis TaxID=2994640 RepID=A0ABT5U3G7_9GAMM|nr:tRNA (cytosine(32)/uridine(32)-2'-O)-methyltransferase TrmJ [Spartinivicinus sp. A2-2]MDE1460516.1 tRNA (cytosine(32)/uridine(32)-2'-O)-methyltransferase TrmJ [Spartinivicinus sp. A2-2]